MKLHLLMAVVAAAALASCGQDPTPEGTGAASGSALQPPAESARDNTDTREETSEVAAAPSSSAKEEDQADEAQSKEGENKAD